MQLKHLKSITQHNDGVVKVTAACWAPNGKRLAVCTTDRVVLMFDEDGVRKDKFATKPIEGGPKNYLVRDMVFSPQSDKLAIAQTDNMVFVYKLGTEWGDKKSICNKFQHSSSITSIVWPSRRLNEIVYGLAEGKVKIGQMKTHKAATLYNSDSYVTAIATNPAGDAIVAAHLDGTIFTFWFDNGDRGERMIARHPCPPFALAWGTSISVAGNDGQVTFYDEDGGEEHTFDYSKEEGCREFTKAVANPTGDAIVMGNYDSFYVFARNKDTMGWEEKSITNVENMYSVTALDWRSDGSKLAVGTLTGVVDLYDVCVRRSLYKGGFELTYVSHSQVIVHKQDTNSRIVVRSQYGCEITKTNIYQSRYVVAHTTDTLICGDMETLRMSEIQWHGDGTEKFIFDNPGACIIYFAGEATMVEYGVDEALGSIRTSHVNRHVLSLRLNERPMRAAAGDFNASTADNKKAAFLLDSQTACVKDLVQSNTVTVMHDAKIDWLELNSRADLLLFRDKRRFLHIYDVESQTRNQLLNFCTYVQWVPFSDVVVAQNRNNLCVWYNIKAPDQVTLHSIKGDVEDIERTGGRTEVIVDEGMSQAVYPLDESLIQFGTAIEDRQMERAMDILSDLELTAEAIAMWKQLYNLALMAGDLAIAQRCAAAVCDVSVGKFLHGVNDMRFKAEMEHGIAGQDHYMVRSRMALLRKDLRAAEEELLNQGKVEECIEMYQNLSKYSDAIRVAEQTRHPEAAEMRGAYFQYLLETSQEEAAAALKEKEGDYIQAINLYLKGGMPGKAALIIVAQEMRQPVQLLDTIATALTRAGMFDIAGSFYERLDELQGALDSYIRGNAFKQAVELARRSFPGRVVELQELWGDHLVSQKHVDMAINHYIEAKAYRKAIEAALNARQFPRALQLVDAIDSDTSRPYYKQLAEHYEMSAQYDLAERCYVSADMPQAAVEMYTAQGRWEVAHKLAMSYMSEGQVGLLYISQAQKLEQQGKFREAEKLYITVKEKDLAINMYKRNRRFDDMVRLVQEHRPDLLKETHQFLAQTLEMEGSLREAEHHYVEAQEWHSAVNMYRSNELWDDSFRVAKFYGGIAACKRVTIALLMAVGVVQATKTLQQHGLVEGAIEHAAENGAFDMAFELANHSMPKKLTEIHLKYALYLEDEERFADAEEEFVKAEKPKEAIDMYVHQQDWVSAIRVAEAYDPASVTEVMVAQGKAKADSGDHKAAEEMYLAAGRPELALSMYQEADMWDAAVRLAQQHLPHRIAEVSAAHQRAQARGGQGGSRSDYLQQGRQHEQQRQWTEAIELYLSARSGAMPPSDLEEVWMRAVELARNNLPNRYIEVALDVARRLTDIRREVAAADILFEAGRHEEAIRVCIEGKRFEKAKQLAQGNPTLKNRVEEAYRTHLVTQEDTGELVELGRADVALDVLAKKGDWDRLWEVAAAEKATPSIQGKYAIMQCEELVRGGREDIDRAVRLLQSRPGPTNDSAINLYKRLARYVLSRSKGGGDSSNSRGEGKGYDSKGYDSGKNDDNEMAEYAETIAALRDVLYRAANQMRTTSGGALPSEFQDCLMAVHYQHMYFVCQSIGLNEQAAKCSITLLKYPHTVPQDKAVYQAGMACKDIRNINLAFMLLNRYVDITEAIDSGDINMLDNTDYQDLDAIPLGVALPKQHYLNDDDDREEVRTWVLSVITDSAVDQRIPPREQSRHTLYEGMYSSERPTCIVTGYPVPADQVLEVNSSIANRRDWNAFVSKTKSCPWTQQQQNPLY